MPHGDAPLSTGSNHKIALPVLRALKKMYGPVDLIHVDAHADVNGEMFGEIIAAGTCPGSAYGLYLSFITIESDSASDPELKVAANLFQRVFQLFDKYFGP